MSDTIRWGIISTGNIARKFAHGLSFIPDATLVAIASRSQERADQFGTQFGVPNRHGNYEALANDPDVDVVYIGTPHPFHCQDTLLCLEAGKAVLCEKPFTINAHEAERMINMAREKGLFLMEAMWTRFVPCIVKLRELIAEGAIGELQEMSGDFSFEANFDPKSRLFDPALGGGSLLDIGIYPISFASMLFGPHPVKMESHADIGPTGVDESFQAKLHYAGGQVATVSSSLRQDTDKALTVVGSAGTLHIPQDFYMAERMILSREDEADRVFEIPVEGNGYQYQAVEVMRRLRDGETESEIMPLDETLDIMRILDALRAEWGLQYPTE